MALLLKAKEAEPNIHENEAGEGLTTPAPKSHLTSLLSLES